MRCHPAAVALLLLAGCASTPKPEPMPTLVKVPVVEYVRVPDSLTKPCPVTRVASRTVEAVVSAYNANVRSEEHTSELQSLMRISYAVFCLKKITSRSLERASEILSLMIISYFMLTFNL